MHIRDKIAKKSAGNSQRPDDVALVVPVGQVDEPLSEPAHPGLAGEVGGAGRGRQEGPVGQPAQHQHGGHAGEQLQARSHLQHRL
jgi:hypothetical protein